MKLFTTFFLSNVPASIVPGFTSLMQSERNRMPVPGISLAPALVGNVKALISSIITIFSAEKRIDECGIIF